MQDLPPPDSLDALLEVAPDAGGDRAAILQLLALYSHLVDDFDVALWGALFTQDARFEIGFGRSEPVATTGWDGRDSILGVIAPRQESFRSRGIQRRHYLTNPVVWLVDDDSARVMVYLMLANIDPESGMQVEGTGRYDGIVVRTPAGWRIRHWRLRADGAPVALSGPEGGSDPEAR